MTTVEADRQLESLGGVDVEWVAAEAEAMPLSDNSFDVVMTCVGVMCAPHHQPSAGVRPGQHGGLLIGNGAGGTLGQNGGDGGTGGQGGTGGEGGTGSTNNGANGADGAITTRPHGLPLTLALRTIGARDDGTEPRFGA